MLPVSSITSDCTSEPWTARRVRCSSDLPAIAKPEKGPKDIRGGWGTTFPGGPRRPAQVSIGRFELRPDYRQTTIRALGNEEVRSHLELNHQPKVDAVLDPFDAVMCRAAGYSHDSRVGMLFATSIQGANWEQEPDLRTEVATPNGYLRTFDLTDRRWKRALVANPVTDDRASSKTRRLVAVRV